jgi:hypothetical protein
MLTMIYTLGLYWLPRASQPLKRLQGPWSEPSTNDLPPTAPNRKAAKTAQVANGPRIEPLHLILQEGPHWQGRTALDMVGFKPAQGPAHNSVRIFLDTLTPSGSPTRKLREGMTKFDAQLAAFHPALALAEAFLENYQH